MSQSSRKRRLWRDLTVFDGLQVLAEPMAVLVEGDRIAGLWPERDFDPMLAVGAEEAGRGGVMTPGLVDCHTHLVYAGDRAGEFEQRLEGVSYEQIARAGGGILSSVRATRAASEDQLIAASLPRLDALLASGCASCVAWATTTTLRPPTSAPPWPLSKAWARISPASWC